MSQNDLRDHVDPVSGPDWFRLSAEGALEKLEATVSEGLGRLEVDSRRALHGTNEIVGRDGRGPLRILREQLVEPMVILLIVAAGVSFAIGEATDSVAILVIVVLNSVLGFVQDYRAEKAMARLKEMAAPEVHVRREGNAVTIPARELVPGDILLVKAGDRVSADCRLIEGRSLECQEAALTGESQPVEKITEPLDESALPVADRRNMIFMGTDVTAGRGEAVVAETGMHTELGKIAGLIQSAGEKRTPLQRRLARLGVRLAIAALAIVAVVFVLGLLRGQELNLMLMTALSLAVAAVPEGLPAVATISLALGARRMLRRNALIRKLPAVETLGSVTVICTDKTGTLTANRMEVTELSDGEFTLDLKEHLSGGPEILAEDNPRVEILRERPAFAALLVTEMLCNDAELDPEQGDHLEARGDPTEGALVVAAAHFGFDKNRLECLLPRIGEAPFDSERKRMTTIHRVDESLEFQGLAATALELLMSAGGGGPGSGSMGLMKGATDAVLETCTKVLTVNGILPLDESRREMIRRKDDELAATGHRVLGFAFRRLEGDDSGESGSDPVSLERDFVFVGLAGMIDPPRAETKEAVARCRTAGIRPVMITGDHPRTAQFIAQEIGIAAGGEEAMTGRVLEKTSGEELTGVVQMTSVYARVSPEHKLRIVEALQKNGEIVAMTGDGVNDAPALKKADIGVAMGITGTDVSKDAAETVLLDDDFATIVASVEEGRTIYDNIRKFLNYTLTSNTGEIFVMVLAPLLGMPLPLIPLQILWINLVTDGLPGLALAVDPAERDIMHRPPRRPEEPVLTPFLIRHILVIGALMGIVSLGTGYFFWRENPTLSYAASWGTIIFTVLTLSQMGNALAVRSSRDSLFRIGFFSNPALFGAVILTLVLQMAVVYLPFLQKIFKTTALDGPELLVCLALSTIVFWAVEVEKWLIRRRSPG